MKRTTWNLLIDALAAFFFLAMIATGYILRFPLPPGTNKSLSLWGLTRHQWGGVHFWISLGLLAVLLTHLALHWQWVATVVARQLGLTTNPQGRHLRSGVITVVAVAAALGLFAWAAEVSVRDRDDPCCPPGEAAGAPGTRTPASGETRAAGESGKVSFWKDVYPVLESSCLSCHGPNRARGGFRVDRREDYFGKDGRPALVVPGRSAESPLVAIVTGARKDIAMADRHRLPETDVSVLKRWIDAGAEWPERSPAGQPTGDLQAGPAGGGQDVRCLGAKAPTVRSRVATVRRPEVRRADRASSVKRSNVGAVKAGASGRSTQASGVGRIRAGRPWAIAQEVGATPMLPTKAARQNSISRAEADPKRTGPRG